MYGFFEIFNDLAIVCSYFCTVFASTPSTCMTITVVVVVDAINTGIGSKGLNWVHLFFPEIIDKRQRVTQKTEKKNKNKERVLEEQMFSGIPRKKTNQGNQVLQEKNAQKRRRLQRQDKRFTS